MLRLPEPPPWQDDARCHGKDPDLFFPTRGENTKALRAKAVCRACPVRLECLEYALSNREPDGIWGGMGIKERERERRRRERGLPPPPPPKSVVMEHGTAARYKKGCHCPDCLAANARRVRECRAGLGR